MKESLKSFLKKAGIYYFIQGKYRQSLFGLSVLLNRIKYARYKGNGYTCNFCNHQYKKFAPRYPSAEDAPALEKYGVIGGDGENVYCPNCGSTCRERLILQVLKERVLFKQKKILHASPEKKIFDFLKSQAIVTTIDVEPGFYKLIDKNIVQADARRLPFDDKIFDIVIANHIMEHIPEDITAMKEFYRVLIPGGRAIVQIPFSEKIPSTIEEPFINDPQRQSVLFGQKDHVRIYNLNDYLQRLSQAGFFVQYIKQEELKMHNIFAFQPTEGFIDCIKP